jgi:hypothetical protein
MLDQLTITKTLNEMAEANQARQDCHDSGVSEAQCRGVETIFTVGRSGDLMEGHHIGGWQSLYAFGVTQTPVGGFANSPEGIPVFRADPASNKITKLAIVGERR